MTHSPKSSSNHTIQTSIAVSNAGTLLQAISDSSILVGYIMTRTTNVVIAATSTGAVNNKCVAGSKTTPGLNNGQYGWCTAQNSTNALIAQSSTFITSLGITKNTTLSDPANGLVYSITFWNYGSAIEGTGQAFAQNSGGIGASTYMNYQITQDVGRLEWMIVSVAAPIVASIDVSSTVSATSTSTVSGIADPDALSVTEDQTTDILGVAGATLFFVLMSNGFIIYLLIQSRKTSPPMSGSSGSNL